MSAANGGLRATIAIAVAVQRLDTLQACAAAMQLWKGGGGTAVALPATTLQHYLRKARVKAIAGPKLDSKGTALARHVSAMVAVAALLRMHGDALEQAYFAASGSGDGSAPSLTKAELVEAQAAKTAELERQLRNSCAEKLKLQNKADQQRRRAHKLSHNARADAREKIAARTVELREECRQQAEEETQKELERMNRLRNQANAKSRAAEARTARAEKDAAQRLKRARDTEETLDSVRNRLDEVVAHERAELGAAAKLALIPTLERTRGAGRGRGALVHAHELRVMGMQQLAHGTPPSAAVNNLISDAAVLVPFLKVKGVTLKWMRTLRREMAIVTEALGAYRIGRAAEVKQMGSDATTRGLIPLMTVGMVLDFLNSDGSKSRVAITSRAGYCTPGETAEIELEAVEEGALLNGARFLERWRAVIAKMYPGQAHSIPDPKKVGLHRLGDGCLLITDTCNGALKFRQLLIELVARRVEESMGAEAWGAMSEDEQERAVLVHQVPFAPYTLTCASLTHPLTHTDSSTAPSQIDCFNHLRNLQLEAGAAKVSAHLKEQLEEDLKVIPFHLRVSTDGLAPIRAVYKEFSRGGEYAKGNGLDFNAWLRKEHGKELVVPIERSTGARQDLVVEGALKLYLNRPFYDEFLDGLLREADHSNILEENLWVIVTSPDMIAMFRYVSTPTLQAQPYQVTLDQTVAFVLTFTPTLTQDKCYLRSHGLDPLPLLGGQLAPPAGLVSVLDVARDECAG